MRLIRRFGVTLYRVTAGVALAACSSGPCVHPPCQIPLAIRLTVTSAGTPAQLTNVFVREGTGANAEGFPCVAELGACMVTGSARTYVLEIGALGFQTTIRTIDVPGETPDCGCPSVETQDVSVALVALQQ